MTDGDDIPLHWLLDDEYRMREDMWGEGRGDLLGMASIIIGRSRILLGQLLTAIKIHYIESPCLPLSTRVETFVHTSCDRSCTVLPITPQS